MAVITPTVRSGVQVVARTTATASDTLTFAPNTNQVLEIHNNTASALTNVTIKGSAPSAAYPVPGVAGLTVNMSAGLVLASVAANSSQYIALDAIAPYLAGTGAVTVSAATGATLVLLTN